MHTKSSKHQSISNKLTFSFLDNYIKWKGSQTWWRHEDRSFSFHASVRLSVCLSVRLSVQTYSPTVFVVETWDLVCRFHLPVACNPICFCCEKNNFSTPKWAKKKLPLYILCKKCGMWTRESRYYKAYWMIMCKCSSAYGFRLKWYHGTSICLVWIFWSYKIC